MNNIGQEDGRWWLNVFKEEDLDEFLDEYIKDYDYDFKKKIIYADHWPTGIKAPDGWEVVYKTPLCKIVYYGNDPALDKEFDEFFNSMFE